MAKSVVVKKAAGRGQKVTAIKRHGEEDESEVNVNPMDAATFVAQKEWKKEFDKETRAEVKAFIVKWKNSTGWKKLIKSMVDVDFVSKKKDE